MALRERLQSLIGQVRQVERIGGPDLSARRRGEVEQACQLLIEMVLPEGVEHSFTLSEDDGQSFGGALDVTVAGRTTALAILGSSYSLQTLQLSENNIQARLVERDEPLKTLALLKVDFNRGQLAGIAYFDDQGPSARGEIVARVRAVLGLTPVPQLGSLAQAPATASAIVAPTLER